MPTARAPGRSAELVVDVGDLELLTVFVENRVDIVEECSLLVHGEGLRHVDLDPELALVGRDRHGPLDVLVQTPRPPQHEYDQRRERETVAEHEPERAIVGLGDAGEEGE